MPWTTEDMKRKGATNPAEAAKVGNAILAKTGDEGKAIRIGKWMGKKEAAKRRHKSRSKSNRKR